MRANQKRLRLLFLLLLHCCMVAQAAPDANQQVECAGSNGLLAVEILVLIFLIVIVIGMSFVYRKMRQTIVTLENKVCEGRHNRLSTKSAKTKKSSDLSAKELVLVSEISDTINSKRSSKSKTPKRKKNSKSSESKTKKISKESNKKESNSKESKSKPTGKSTSPASRSPESKVSKTSKNSKTKKSDDDAQKNKKKEVHAEGSTSEKSDRRKDPIEDFLVKIQPSKRDSIQKTSEPISHDEFFHHALYLSTTVSRYARQPELFSVVTENKFGNLLHAIEMEAPDAPQEFDDVLHFFKERILVNVNFRSHPFNFASIGSSIMYPHVMAEMLNSALNVQGCSYDSCPALADLEVVMVNWYGKMIGLNEKFLFEGPSESSLGGGCIMEDNSELLLNVVLAAKFNKLEQVGPGMPDAPNRLVAYCTSETSLAFESACRLNLIHIRTIDVKSKIDPRMDDSKLEQQIKEDQVLGLLPMIICANVGTPSGAIDKLEDLGRIARSHSIWLHADGRALAYTWIEPKNRKDIEGLATCDTIGAEFGSCTMMWMKYQAKYKTPFTPVNKCKQCRDKHNVCNYGYSSTHRFDCLRLWFAAQLMGVNGLRCLMNRLCDLSAYMEHLLLPHPHIKEFGARRANIFCFQYADIEIINEADVNTYTVRLGNFINRSKKIHVARILVAKQEVLRLSISFERTQKSDIEKAVKILHKLIDDFVVEKDDKKSLMGETSNMCAISEVH